MKAVDTKSSDAFAPLNRRTYLGNLWREAACLDIVHSGGQINT
jgi:hypothetical protein